MITNIFEERLKESKVSFHAVVPFQKGDKLLLLDFTQNNKDLDASILGDTEKFSNYVSDILEKAGASYGIGGYDEHRTIYSRSEVFDGTAPTSSTGEDSTGIEPRRLHLGIDIWGPAGTSVFAPVEGTVHSFGFNDAYGDYGATLILQHDLNGLLFHTLYGHLSLHSIEDKQEGQDIEKGSWIAAFGKPAENGHWPPHLHFQLIIDMQGWKGDYPGVCKFSEREIYLQNCPNPDLLLNMMKHA
jgi:murein DD-endopeptidase MepM/ murein hydrolase activator NlpD